MTVENVAALMAELVKMDYVAPDESFFDVGGTSFLSLTLISRIESDFGVKLSMLDVVRAGTPVNVAELIDAGR
ncbi:phosphopantetheine-binding protein [Actinoplanes sp. Pm04-4]|uniref:Phosphopantetheine-binding protein n=1 Tax=Paractinoplanes pyxinae TaxID=2997416 RepID=A0ABT4BE34_9ACTN|nr:phosphopantetheine-binding protein [Actinoplanes pyxinae]MCY1144085.1 phosphopantetheine-binding protein [Actinoplanes pyxinae]